jgi:uncharacterized membrane protein
MRENNNRRTSNRTPERRHQNNRRPNNLSETLPSPRTLEALENASPGFGEALGNLAENEQKQRHNLQNKHNFSFRIGQIFGIIYNILILAVVVDLSQNGNNELALQIFFINALLMALAILVGKSDGRSSRKPVRRNAPNKR